MTWLQEPPPGAESDDRARLSASKRGAIWGLASALGVVALAFGAGAYQQGVIEDTAREALDLRGDAVESAASAEVSRYLGIASVVADGLATYDRITDANFRRITANIDTMGLDGATSIVYIAPPVATANVAAAQKRWRRTFSPDLALTSDEGSGDHVFVLASTSLDGAGLRPGGVDLSSAPAPFAALMEARRSGEAAVSPAYQLLIDQQLPADQRQTSFSLVVPIDSNGTFQGWVLMGLRGQDFLGHVLDIAGEGSVGTVLEADDVSGAGTRVASVPKSQDGAVLRQGRLLQVAQQQWRIELESDLRSLVGTSRLMPRNARVVGSVLAALVGVLVWVVVTGRARSDQKVLVATADLAAAELVSRRQASMLDAMVETIEEVGVSVVDADGRFLLQSRAARTMLGIDETHGPVADPHGSGTWQENFGLFHLDGAVMAEDDLPLVQALRGEVSRAVPMIVRNSARPDGTRIEVGARPLPLGDGTVGALAVFRDVTQERLQQAELAGFAGVVAHDLRHPLTVISGYLSMISDHCLPELQGTPELLAETATYLAKAGSGAARMAELISDLLDYTTARDADLTYTAVDLRALALEVAATHCESGVRPGHPTPFLHFGDLPTVEGDPDRLRQLFANLIGNAVKYVAPGATPLLDVSASQHGNQVRLRFADRGIGIADDKLSDVFRPFVRAHTGTADGFTYAGTGLGLAICHQVVLRHGGDISVSPNPGGGSIFSVDLPLVRPSQEPLVPATVAVPDPGLDEPGVETVPERPLSIAS